MVNTRDDGYLEQLLTQLMDSGMKAGEEFDCEPHPNVILEELKESHETHHAPGIIWQDLSFVVTPRDGDAHRSKRIRILVRDGSREVTLKMQEEE